MNDEVAEGGLQPDRRPALFDGPSAGSVRNRDAAHAGSLAAADQDVTVRGQGRLRDAGAARPRVLPEQLAIGRRDARRAGFAHQQDLCDSVDRQ